MPSYRGYRPDREEEIKAKNRKNVKEANKRKRLKKLNGYSIRRDDPLDDRI